MSNLYKKIGMALGVLLMISCSKDVLKEDPSFIPENPNPGAEGLPPNDQWMWVSKYPGEVSNSIDRVQNVEVKLSGNYQPKDLNILGNPKYWQSTGLYVPPVEEVIVNLPADAGKLYYQIGIADVVIPAGAKYERFDNVCKSGLLEVGENRLHSNFGGPLYFYFEGNPSDVTLTVSGAVKTLDYTAGKTVVNEWLTAVKGEDAEPMIWGELTGQRIIMTLPIATLKKIERPDALLKFYDEIIDKDFNTVAGFKDEDMQLPWRLYSDIQLPDKALMYPSYPMGFNANTADSISNAIVGLAELEHKGCLTVLKGFAGLFEMPWNSGKKVKSPIQQTLSYHLYQRKGKWYDLKLTTTQSKEPGTRYWMAREADYQSMALQLLQKYGWGFYTYAFKRCREEIKGNVPDQYKVDLYAMYASEYANVDLTDFFAAWSLPVSMYAQQYMKHYPAPTEKFWKTTDVNKQPAFSSETPAGIAYEKVIPASDTVYSRKNWLMAASSQASPVSNLIDGKTSTFWEGSGSNKYPHIFSATFRDDMGEPQEEEFNYFYFAQREHDNPGPKSFVVEIKLEADSDEWIQIEEGKAFYLCRDNTAGKDNYQYVHLSQSYKAYGVQLRLTEGLPRSENGTNVVDYTSLSEFGTGLLK